MKITLCLIGLLLVHLCSAQSKNSFSERIAYLDKNAKPVKERQAALLQQRLYFNDSLWEFNIYYLYGPRAVSMQFRDEEGQVLNGRYIVYSPDGYCDTIGQYVNGKREGVWRVLTPKGRTGYQLDYNNGVLTGVRDSVQLREEARKRSDSAGKVWPTVEIESEFPGGAHGWVQYMLHRLRYPQRAFERHIEGKAAVTFMVDSEGRIETGDMYIQRSVEYSIDQTVLQLIRDSPAWTPATQDGQAVRSYKTQPFGFKLPAK